MSIEVTCLQCQTSHHVNDRLAGRKVRCPNCDTAVHVPERDVVLGGDDPSGDATSSGEVLEVELVGEHSLDPKPVTPQSAIDFSSLSRPTTNPLAANQANGALAGPTTTPLEDEDDEDDEVLVRNKRPEEEMDMTPMVDVTFLLLIFFMVTAAFSLQKSIEMPRQQTDAPSTSVIEEESEDLDMVEVQVDEFGSFLVMAPDWERETPGKQNLISTLKEAAGNNNDGMRLVIKVHEMAKLHALVDAMDAGTIAGYAQLEVTQVEEFE